MTEGVNLRYVIFLGCTAALGGLLFGFDIAIITGAGPFLIRVFSLSDFGLGWHSVRCSSAACLGRLLREVYQSLWAQEANDAGGAAVCGYFDCDGRIGGFFSSYSGAVSGRAGRGRSFTAVAAVRVGGFAADHAGTHGNSLSDVDRGRHHRILWHQFPAPRYGRE